MKLRDLRSDTATKERENKLSKAGLNCYLTEGFSAKFLFELEKLSTHYFYKWNVKAPLEVWLDLSRDHIIDVLPRKFNPEKGQLVPYIVTCLQRHSWKVSRLPEYKLAFEPSADSNDDVTVYGSSPVMVRDDLDVYAFERRAHDLGIQIDVEKVRDNLAEGIFSPMATVFGWLRAKGELG